MYKNLEAYLEEIGHFLSGPVEREEILDEIRSHILEKIEQEAGPVDGGRAGKGHRRLRQAAPGGRKIPGRPAGHRPGLPAPPVPLCLRCFSPSTSFSSSSPWSSRKASSSSPSCSFPAWESSRPSCTCPWPSWPTSAPSPWCCTSSPAAARRSGCPGPSSPRPRRMQGRRQRPGRQDRDHGRRRDHAGPHRLGRQPLRQVPYHFLRQHQLRKIPAAVHARARPAHLAGRPRHAGCRDHRPVHQGVHRLAPPGLLGRRRRRRHRPGPDRRGCCANRTPTCSPSTRRRAPLPGSTSP